MDSVSDYYYEHFFSMPQAFFSNEVEIPDITYPGFTLPEN